MNRPTAILALLLCAAAPARAGLSQPGDLAFTAFNADEDGFAVVALRDIAPQTRVYFNDNEWLGGAPLTGSFNSGESLLRWVSGTDAIAAGTVVRFSAIDKTNRAASVGTFNLVGGTSGFSANGDTLFAYLGDASGNPTAFLAALSSENFAGSDLTGSGLVIGQHALAITNGADFGEYVGPRSGLTSFGAYGELLNNPVHWSAHATGAFEDTLPNLTPFTVAAVPEPETYALLLTGMGLVGWRLQKTRRTLAPRALDRGPLARPA